MKERIISNYNLLPTIVLSLKIDGFIVAFKFICFHVGINQPKE